MKEYGREETVQSFNLQSLLQLIRAAGAILGFIAIVIGLVYATRLFDLVFDTLKSPEIFQENLDKWVMAVGGGKLDVALEGTTFQGSRIIALMTLGGGTFLLTLLSLGIIVTGAKVLYWTLSDREAIRQLLAYAFGPAKKPEPITTHGGGK
jgi:hypothetical protein